jgi:tryptophan 2,3-dioxygenase
VTPLLGKALSKTLRDHGVTLLDVYVHGREHEDLYGLAEALIEWDERLTLWRTRHYKVVARIIGDEVVGTQGTPVELLGGLIKQKSFPELWEVRNRLTQLANEQGVGEEA